MLELTDIRVAYDSRPVLEIDHLSIPPGRFTALLGHNGSGKSTLLRLFAREIRPTRGEARLRGRPLASFRQRELARRLAYLPQRLPEVPGLDVRELCGLGRFPWRGALGRWRAEDHAAVERALAETGLASFADHLVDELSGGERQRAWIAMLLAQEAPTLLLDEPISALDPAHQLEVLNLLGRLVRSEREVVAILHDVNLAARFAHRIVALKRGRIAFDGPPRAFMQRDTLSMLFDVPIELVQRAGRLPLAVIGEEESAERAA